MIETYKTLMIVWARRPSLPRQPIVSIDSDSDTEWLH